MYSIEYIENVEAGDQKIEGSERRVTGNLDWILMCLPVAELFVWNHGFMVLILFEKTKPIWQFIVRSSWFIAKMRKGYLKIQSQFAGMQNNIRCYTKEVYANTPAIGARKNKANLLVHGCQFIVHGKND